MKKCLCLLSCFVFCSVWGQVRNVDSLLEEATILEKQADSLNAIGKIGEAKYLCFKALEIKERVWGKEHKEYAKTLSSYALYNSNLGDHIEAIRICSKALAIKEAAYGIENLDYAKTLSNMALYNYRLGKYEEAIKIGTDALNILRNFGSDDADYAKILNNLACSYSKNGNDSMAIRLLTDAMEIKKKTFGSQHSSYAISLNNLAVYYSKTKRYKEAIQMFNEAMEIQKNVLGTEHPEYGLSLRNIAMCYFSLKNYSEATSYMVAYISIEATNVVRNISSMSSVERKNYWERKKYLFFRQLPNYISKNPNPSIISCLYDNSALFAKGLLLTTEMEMNRLIQESGDDESLGMYEELHIKRRQLQKLYETPIDKRHVNSDSLALVVDQLEKKLVEKSQVYGDFTKKLHTKWKDVQSVLEKDEIAVEFLSFDELETNCTKMVALTLRDNDKEPKLIPLFELGQLQRVGDTENFICPEVAKLIWEPLQKELYGIRRIYFSPAGVLHKIGIEYLPGMETYDLYRLSTTREIIDLKAKKTSFLKNQAKAILYGGVNYEASNSLQSCLSNKKLKSAICNDYSSLLAITLHRAFVDSIDLRGMKADYLPSTLTEVKNICSSLDKASLPAIVYIGAYATETSVKSLSGNAPSILHISTHGFYFSEKKARRADLPRSLSIENERNASLEDKALTRSGLLMAGAELSLNGEDIPLDIDDGILTSQEISQLDFRGLDLVVLSACETGMGDIMQGEGVFGLQRGFKKAGAQTILMSLWKVNDFATEMLMTEFYKNLCEGKSKRESLRLAQKFLKEYKGSDGTYLFNAPHYWAGFVMLD